MTAWQTMRVETVRGTYEVFIKGEGAPLCVTHLYSQYNASGDFFAEAFVAHHKVFLVNLKGAGHSDPIVEESELSLFEAVKDLEAVRTALGYASWTFAGHSTGGMIGLAYAVQFGAALDALVVVGSAASRDYHVMEDSIYNRNHPKYLVNNGYLRQLMEPTLSPEERKEISRERTKLSLFRPERYDEYFTGASYKVMNAPRLAYFDRHAFDVREQLPALQTKTLIICGAHDVQCPLRYSIDMHERLPGSELVVFEESNHYPFLEEPQKFADTIKRFFDIA